MNKDKYLPKIILWGFAILIFIFFNKYLSSSLLAEDLPAHIEITKRMLKAKRIIFYDPYWFSGWPAFQFYGFLPHLIIAIVSKIFFNIYSIETIIRFSSLLAISLLPFSFYFVVNSIKNEKLVIRSLISGFITIWFLLLDEAFFGLGLASIFTVGLFPQVFGWHLILIGLGLLIRAEKKLTLIIAISFLTHTLSAFFLLLICFIWLIIFSENRKNLIINMSLAIGMIAFWLYPFLKYNSSFTSADVYQVPSDWLSLLIRYPISDIKLKNLLSFDLDFFRLIFVFSLFALLLKKLHNKLSIALSITVLLLSLFATSNLIAINNPLAIHYYRISGLIILLVLCLISHVLAELSVNRISKTLIISILILSSINLFRLNPEPAKLIYVNKDLESITKYLFTTNERVFIEFNNDYHKVIESSAHYLESSLFPKEVINGLFVESSNLSRYLAFSADILEGSSFHGYLLFVNGTDIDKSSALEQFKNLGISKIVSSTDKFSKNLEQLLGEAVFSSGTYKIYQLTPEHLLKKVNKPLVTYIDLCNELPFSIISQYFYSNSQLYNSFELINSTYEIPEQTSHLIINGTKSEIINHLSKNKTNAKIIPFFKSSLREFNHHRKIYRPDKKVEAYYEVKKFFDETLKLKDKIKLETTNNLSNNPIEVVADFNHIKTGKLFSNNLYRLNYTYSPLLNAKDLKIYRGLAERIYLIPEVDGEFDIKFSIFNASYYLLAILFSICSFLIYLIYAKN